MELTRKEILKKGIKNIRILIQSANIELADDNYESARVTKYFAYGQAQLLIDLLGCESKERMLIDIINNMIK